MHRVLSHSIAAELKEIRSVPDSNGSQVAGGPALSTTLKALSIPFGADWISITPRNFAGCGVARVALNPRLTIVVTTDLLATGTKDQTASPTTIKAFPTQVISDEMQDGDVTDFAMDDFTTFALGAAIYIGADAQFRGVAADLGSEANANAQVLTVKYPARPGGGWTDIADSDGTETGGTTTMAQDGNVTWTVPAAWAKTSLNATGDTVVKEPWAIASLYWTRWEVSGALDASWDLAQMRALNRSTAYAELLEGQPLECAVDPREIATVEALTDAGTANLVVNVGVLDMSVTGRKEEFK